MIKRDDQISRCQKYDRIRAATPETTGAAKPDLKAFLAVLAKMKVDPEEAVMVGDSVENDILPAKELGMKPVLINRGRKAKKPDDSSIAMIKNLGELKRFL